MRLIDADAFDKMLVDAQAECKSNGGNFRFGVLSNVRENLRMMPTIEQERRWIPVSERLPENAHHPEIVCPTCRVMTPWGESQGWYNPSDDGWWVLLWFKYDDEKVPNFKEGTSPIVQFETEKGTMVTHWMPQSQPPKEGDGE